MFVAIPTAIPDDPFNSKMEVREEHLVLLNHQSYLKNLLF